MAAEVENGHAEAEVSTPSYLVADVSHAHDAESFSRNVAAHKEAWIESSELRSSGIVVAHHDIASNC